MTALFISVNMTLALYGCGSQPATPVAEQNQTENSESLYDEDVVVEVSTADEESSDDTKEENMDNDSGDLSEDSTVLDSDDAEESDEIFSNNISIKKTKSNIYWQDKRNLT